MRMLMRNVDKNLKHEIEFIIESNESSLADTKITIEIKQLQKQQNELIT